MPADSLPEATGGVSPEPSRWIAAKGKWSDEPEVAPPMHADDPRRFNNFVAAICEAIRLNAEDTEDALNWPYENLLPQLADLYNRAARTEEASR
jgi:hypothetical protein